MQRWDELTLKEHTQAKNNWRHAPDLYHWLCEKNWHVTAFSLCDRGSEVNHDNYCRVRVACLMIQLEVEYRSRPLIWHVRFNEWGISAASYRWTGWVYKITSCKFKTLGELPTVLEESIIKQNRKISTCNRLCLETLGSWSIMLKNVPAVWFGCARKCRII